MGRVRRLGRARVAAAPTVSELPGAAVWLALVLALGAWTVLTAVTAQGRLPTVVDVVRWCLESWAGRIVLLAMWAEAGFHVFTQRP